MHSLTFTLQGRGCTARHNSNRSAGTGKGPQRQHPGLRSTDGLSVLGSCCAVAPKDLSIDDGCCNILNLDTCFVTCWRGPSGTATVFQAVTRPPELAVLRSACLGERAIENGPTGLAAKRERAAKRSLVACASEGGPCRSRNLRPLKAAGRFVHKSAPIAPLLQAWSRFRRTALAPSYCRRLGQSSEASSSLWGRRRRVMASPRAMRLTLTHCLVAFRTAQVQKKLLFDMLIPLSCTEPVLVSPRVAWLGFLCLCPCSKRLHWFRHKPNEWLLWDRQTPMISMYHKERIVRRCALI